MSVDPRAAAHPSPPAQLLAEARRLAASGDAAPALRDTLDALEAALRQAPAGAAEQVLDTVSDAFLALDAGWRITYANRCARELLSRAAPAADDPMGRVLWDLLPGLRGSVWERVRQVAVDGRPASFETWSRPLGAWFGVRAFASADGGITLYLDDITRRRRAEDARAFLDEASTLLASSLDHTATLGKLAEVAARALADYCVLYLGDAENARVVAASHRDPLRAARMRAALAGPLPDSELHPVTAALRTGRPQLLSSVDGATLDALATGARGAVRDLRLRSLVAAPLRVRGEALGAVLLARTQSAAPFDGEDLATACELAVRAAVAVDHARLYQTARDAVAGRDDLVAVVSHDLRNPLNAILLAAALLDDVLGDDAHPLARAQVGIVRRSAEGMATLVRDLVEVASLEHGRGLPVTPRAMAPATLLRGAEEMFAAVAAAKGIVLEAADGAALPAVHADHGRVLQVFGNLLSNAIKFTPEGGRIVVSAAVDGAFVRLSVADTGPGIEAAHVARLFDRFWQARRQQNAGAGLGLAIAKAVVEAHGGRIWVETEFGAGATFHFLLPVVEVEVVAA